MLYWLRYPFIRFTPALGLGIIIYEASGNPGINWILPAVSIVAIALLFSIQQGKRFFSLNPLIGVITLILFVITGFLAATINYQLNSPDHFSKKTFTYYHGAINTWPEERGNFCRAVVKILAVKDSSWIKAKGKIQVYLPKNSINSISYGSVLLVKGAPRETNDPRNPYEFNYKRYLARKSIFHQHFLENNEYVITGKEYPNKLKAYAGILRNKADNVLKKHIEYPDRLNIARAMLLGIRSGMDDEMKAAYSHAGAMHILAISGLHVGIIYGFLALILIPIKNRPRGKIIFTVTILLVLWSYALLVGLSPSVMRATVMFSLITIGQAFYRTPDIFNTIAFSAFLLLIIDPFQLFEVGFQLSYLAVIGIVLIYRNINSWVSSKYWVINKVWAITSIAIAAQLMTFPLGLHYFHNFPNLFFISNLIVIPSAFIVLISGSLLLLSSVFSLVLLTNLFANVLSFTLGIMNKGVFSVENMPYSNISEVYLPSNLTLLLYLVIIGIIALFLTKKVQWLYFVGIVWLGFFLTISVFQVRRYNAEMLIIYDIASESIFDFVNGGRIKCNAKVDTQQDYGYQIDNFRIASAISREIGRINFHEDANLGVKLFTQGADVLVWIDRELPESYEVNKKVDIDYLLISYDAVKDFHYLTEIFEPEQIILDSSNDYFYSINAIRQLEEMGINVYSTRQSGGLLIDLKSNRTNVDI